MAAGEHYQASRRQKISEGKKKKAPGEGSKPSGNPLHIRNSKLFIADHFHSCEGASQNTTLPGFFSPLPIYNYPGRGMRRRQDQLACGRSWLNATLQSHYWWASGCIRNRLSTTTTSHKPQRFGSRTRLLSVSSKEGELVENMCHLCILFQSLGQQPLDQIGVANAVQDKWGLFYASPETANLKTVLLYLNLISIVSQHARMVLVSDDYFHCCCSLGWTRGKARGSYCLCTSGLPLVYFRVRARVTTQTDQYASQFFCTHVKSKYILFSSIHGSLISNTIPKRLRPTQQKSAPGS